MENSKPLEEVWVLSQIRWVEWWSGLRPNTQTVLSRLYDLTLALSYPYFEGSIEELAKFSGVSPSVASGSIKQLKEFGIVTIAPGEIAIVIDPSKWRISREERAQLEAYCDRMEKGFKK